MGWHYQNLETAETFISIDLAAKSVGVHRSSILRAIEKNWKCAGAYWKKLPEPIPSWYTSKPALQKKLDALRIDGTPRQIVISKPSRYARGKDNPRYYVNIKCSKHGPYSVAKRRATPGSRWRCRDSGSVERCPSWISPKCGPSFVRACQAGRRSRFSTG